MVRNEGSIPSELESRIERRLYDRYGELLTVENLAEVLRYESTGALMQALYRGTFLIPLLRWPNRRGYFARVADVAAHLARCETVVATVE